jgi:hypothetical protein
MTCTRSTRQVNPPGQPATLTTPSNHPPRPPLPLTPPQLIYDLHQVNSRAKVSVKLVAEAGIGVVASGVAKANADIIQVGGR